MLPERPWNAKVWIDADAFTETDAELIPTGTVVPGRRNTDGF